MDVGLSPLKNQQFESFVSIAPEHQFIFERANLLKAERLNTFPDDPRHYWRCTFALKGTFQGKLHIHFDKTRLPVSVEAPAFLKGLFVESFNILLGQWVTDYERTHRVPLEFRAPVFEDRPNRGSESKHIVQYHLVLDEEVHLTELRFEI